MIVVKIYGGLGNQLFQYACARALSVKTDQTLLMEMSYFIHNPHRTTPQWPYQLDCYSIAAHPIEPDTPWEALPQYHEKSFYYDPEVLNLSGPVFLKGFWQSPQYFESIQSLLRKELTYKHALNSNLLDQVTSTHSVGLHIRRGDYLLPQINSSHPVLSLSYYHQASDLLGQRFENLHFFVFSDDPTWAETHLNLPYPVTLINTQNAMEDFELQRACQHNIIANSSFSWWAAWLNNSPGKQVVAPKYWLKSDPNITRDLLPSNWLNLEVKEETI